MLSFPNAKINLGLQIKSKRLDGYHEIESCMYPVGLCDVLEIIPDSKDSFHSTGLAISGNPESNLCLKALHLLRQHFTVPPVYIHLHKVIPHGAGLGGGSADASHTLKMLNTLFDLKLKTQEIKNLSAEIGSDCPFFVENNPTISSGRGEILDPIDISLKGYNILLIHPGFSISTALAYSLTKPEMPKTNLQNILKKDISKWREVLTNDFQQVLESEYPELKKLRTDLYNMGASYASMSGSGSAYFGIFKTLPKNISKQFPDHYFKWSSIL